MTRLILQGANLFDGERPPRADATVVVEGERIAAVLGGPAPDVRPDDRVVDLSGKTLMPGMYSCHFHSAYHDVDPGRSPLGMDHPPTYLALLAARNVHRALMCGFTGIVGAGAGHAIDATLKQAIEAGVIQGPRIMAGSTELVASGDAPDPAMGRWWMQIEGPAGTRACDGPEEFRRVVREEIRRGAEIIKLNASGGHLVPVPFELSLAEDELRAAVDAAHERGAKVRVHCASKRSILTSVRCSVDVLDHADAMDAECIEAFVKNATFVAPTLFLPQRVLEVGRPDDRPEDAPIGIGDPATDIPATRYAFEHMCKIVPEANAAGVKLVTGDDYGTGLISHGEYAAELELYVKQAGLAPLDVLRWATRNGAELMGAADELGTVEAGKLADLIVVDGDPTLDVAILQDPDRLLAILKGGELVKDRLADG